MKPVMISPVFFVFFKPFLNDLNIHAYDYCAAKAY